MNNSIFSINNRSITKNDPPYIIAEISANHNGSIQLAKETILAAKNSGVDAVKIQTYTPDTMTIDANNPDFYISDGLWKDRSLYDLYNKAHTPFEWHEELFEYSKELDITLFSTPFDETAVDLLESLNTPAYKIASFEIVDLSLIEYIAKKNRPILISTGMASIEEIKDALDVVYSTGNDQVALFHCISSYPAPISEANLNSLNILS
ncbi:pseudaminic acid synthase, partial [archaeon]|nr:pseudaminic acid synthase [archaeon]